MLKFKFPHPFNDGDDDDGAGGFSSKFEASVPRQKGEGGSEASKQHRFNVITNFLFFAAAASIILIWENGRGHCRKRERRGRVSC